MTTASAPRFQRDPNRYLSPEAIQIVGVLASGPKTLKQIASVLGRDPRELDEAMRLLRKHGRIRRKTTHNNARIWELIG